MGRKQTEYVDEVLDQVWTVRRMAEADNLTRPQAEGKAVWGFRVSRYDCIHDYQDQGDLCKEDL